jgi:hypothetical protein
MVFDSPEVISERAPVVGQLYDKTEFYIGLCLAISSSLFIGKYPYSVLRDHLPHTDLATHTDKQRLSTSKHSTYMT